MEHKTRGQMDELTSGEASTETASRALLLTVRRIRRNNLARIGTWYLAGMTLLMIHFRCCTGSPLGCSLGHHLRRSHRVLRDILLRPMCGTWEWYALLSYFTVFATLSQG